MLPYEKIDTCVNDCVLFKRKYENAQSCLIVVYIDRRMMGKYGI